MNYMTDYSAFCKNGVLAQKVAANMGTINLGKNKSIQECTYAFKKSRI